MKHKIDVLLVGGGTGGHIGPIFNVYNDLKEKDPKLKIAVVGSGSAIERIFFGSNDSYITIKAARFRNRFDLWQVVVLIASVVSSFFLLKRLNPKVIFSKGGYVALPIILCARFLNIPYMFHESDVEMGGANRFSIKGAKKFFTGFPIKYYTKLPMKKAVFTGQLLKNEITKPNYNFGFSDKKSILLVTGGSLGAMSLNKCVFASLPVLLGECNIIHQTGANGYKDAIEKRASLPDGMKSSYYVTDFLKPTDSLDMRMEAINICDLALARAGATTIGELALSRKPMILVPYPYAAADHQSKNAMVLEKNEGCIVIQDRDLNTNSLISAIKKISDDSAKMNKMTENAHNLFPEDGLKIVTKEILKEVK